MEAGILIAAETTPWHEMLTEAGREECASELTDAYFAALTSGDWAAFRSLVQQWRERAEAQELVTA
ncbi:MAG TPA: hypothetical protein VHB98_11375, partial [Chloroflexota bacterium]|nr:hypothetical protein [Chloroflexota bacterium]